ncbi:MAG: threonine synthase [Bacillota bacterium]
MQYISTRGMAASKPFKKILLEGLAEDGGLYVPGRLPSLSPEEWNGLAGKDYVSVALAVLSKLASDIPPDDLKRLLEDTYVSGSFETPVVPLQQLDDDIWLMKLSQGPTLAFKDIALQLVGRLMSYVLEEQGGELNILGATSGDTGSAAAHAIRGRDNLRLFMLSPKDRMSPFQRAQMYTLDEPNIFNLVVEGTFDDCQNVVKAVNADATFKAQFNIGAMNSINFARIAAQIVYCFWACRMMAGWDKRRVSFGIPSGNFGNALAAHMAGMMGAPIGQVIVATNENDVLDEFFRTGIYRPRKGEEVHITSSPSMDIALASNFERYVFELFGGRGDLLRAEWERLDSDGCLDLAPPFQVFGGPEVVSGKATQAEVLDTIRMAHREYGIIIDPHTAIAMKVGLERRSKESPLVIAETAQPAKFEATIREALGIDPPRPTGYENIESLPEQVTHIAADPDRVKEFIRAHAA